MFALDYRNSMRTKTAKTKEEWKTIKKKLTGERGLWKMEILDSSSLRISAEDPLGNKTQWKEF